MSGSVLPNEETHSLNFESLREVRDFHIGSIDETRTSTLGGRFIGWAVEKESGRSAVAFIARGSTGALVFLPPNRPRPDVAAKLGQNALHCGIDDIFPLKLIEEIYCPRIKYYAYDGKETITELPVAASRNSLAKLAISGPEDFFRLIQTPSTRISDDDALAHISFHVLQRTIDDFPLSASAACVAGYRLLEGQESSVQNKDAILNHVSRLLSVKPNIDRGLYLRWHTSLQLIAGYLAYQVGRDEDALQHFEAITHFAIELKRWPQALTNILIGVVVAGYLHYERDQQNQAAEFWNRAEDILRYGASVAEFQNFYAYGELLNATRVAQFAYTALRCAGAGGTLNDVSIAPLGTTIDMHLIPGPIGKLTHARRAHQSTKQRI